MFDRVAGVDFDCRRDVGRLRIDAATGVAAQPDLVSTAGARIEDATVGINHVEIKRLLRRHARRGRRREQRGPRQNALLHAEHRRICYDTILYLSGRSTDAVHAQKHRDEPHGEGRKARQGRANIVRWRNGTPAGFRPIRIGRPRRWQAAWERFRSTCSTRLPPHNYCFQVPFARTRGGRKAHNDEFPSKISYRPSTVHPSRRSAAGSWLAIFATKSVTDPACRSRPANTSSGWPTNVGGTALSPGWLAICPARGVV